MPTNSVRIKSSKDQIISQGFRYKPGDCPIDIADKLRRSLKREFKKENIKFYVARSGKYKICISYKFSPEEKIFTYDSIFGITELPTVMNLHRRIREHIETYEKSYLVIHTLEDGRTVYKPSKNSGRYYVNFRYSLKIVNELTSKNIIGMTEHEVIIYKGIAETIGIKSHNAHWVDVAKIISKQLRPGAVPIFTTLLKDQTRAQSRDMLYEVKDSTSELELVVISNALAN